MGYDLFGQNPRNKSGEYFRNNAWWWPKLWSFTYLLNRDILTEEDYRKGNYNQGYLITEDKAKKIAERLREAVEKPGKYKQQINFLEASHDLMEETIEKLSKSGHAVLTPTDTEYKFDWENVKEFAEFCENSGGFEIW